MERRPNPPGWVPPKAPYNPYDPSDLRPAEGYPSEFNTPGRPRRWTQVPKQASQYQEMKDTLRKLNYTPRPASELYPGQYKVLRRKGGSHFNHGVRLIGKTMTFVIIVGSVFFYRWNDGYDNVFSTPYRLQLRLRQKLFGNLSPQQLEDLEGKQRGMIRKVNAPSQVQMPTEPIDSQTALERPQAHHYVEAERRMQERQEAILKAVRIAKSKLNDEQDGADKPKKSWKWW